MARLGNSLSRKCQKAEKQVEQGSTNEPRQARTKMYVTVWARSASFHGTTIELEKVKNAEKRCIARLGK